MIPLGYMAKRIPSQRPEWMQAPAVKDVYSVSDCVNDNMVDVNSRWDHNGYGLFDTPEEIRTILGNNGLRTEGVLLFYYEAYELEFDGEHAWSSLGPDVSFETKVVVPERKRLEGFDVVTFCDGTNSHSPLSCNGVAADVSTNEHCLFGTEEEAFAGLRGGASADSEPGPYRVYAVYTVGWR